MKKYVLITGASAGIGYELAKLFAGDGHNLILVARSKENLDKVANELKAYSVEIMVKSFDLSIINQCDELIKFIKESKLDIEILVNNAGIGSFGEFRNIPWEEEEKLIDINIKALSKLTKALLPQMVKEKCGGILNVASTAAFASGPKMANYYASKAYVLSLTEAVYEEVKDFGVKVSCLCPGPVKTDFQNKAGIKKSEKAKKYLMEPDKVAKVAYDQFNKGKVIIVPGIKNKILVLANKFLPRAITRRIILNTNKG